MPALVRGAGQFALVICRSRAQDGRRGPHEKGESQSQGAGEIPWLLPGPTKPLGLLIVQGYSLSLSQPRTLKFLLQLSMPALQSILH